MRVDVDRAREDEQPGRVDDLARAGREAGEVGLDRLDPPATDRESARRDPSARTTVPPVMRRSGVPVTGAG